MRRSEERLRPDRQLRRAAMRAVALGFAAGWAGLLAVQALVRGMEIDAAAAPHAAARAEMLMRAVTVAVAAGAALAGACVLAVAVRALRAGTFPPPGTRVLVPVVVVRGAAARRRALAALVVAAALIAGAIALPLGVWNFVARVSAPTARP